MPDYPISGEFLPQGVLPTHASPELPLGSASIDLLFNGASSGAADGRLVVPDGKAGIDRLAAPPLKYDGLPQEAPK